MKVSETARENLGQRRSYRVASVLSAREVYHAINAGKGGSGAAIAMGIEFLLGEDVTARLYG